MSLWDFFRLRKFKQLWIYTDSLAELARQQADKAEEETRQAYLGAPPDDFEDAPH